MSKRKPWPVCLAAAAFATAAVLCGSKIYRYYSQIEEEAALFDDLLVYVTHASGEEAEEGEDSDAEIDADTLFDHYFDLYLLNHDFAGWLSIEDTTIDYPVMQTVDNPNYYLNHNFYKEASSLGTPYLQENCNIFSSDNLIIYGHHIRAGKMFSALESYRDAAYWQEHPIIRLDTLTETREYRIFAVFTTVAYSDAGFRYYDYVNDLTLQEFNTFVDTCKDLALYDTGITPEWGQQMITLSTCEYSAKNGRLVVVGVRVE